MGSSIFSLPIFFFLLLLQPQQPFSSRTYRRTLHGSFFSLSSTPQAQAPSPSFPQYPSSSLSKPFTFFPLYASSPPPPSSLPTFPTLVLPKPESPSHHHHRLSTKLLMTIFIPTISFVLFLIFLVSVLRRRGSTADDSRSDSHRLFPPKSAASDGPISSEFLYLGTLINSRGHSGEIGCGSRQPQPPSQASESPYQKLDSPELRPLPPLCSEPLPVMSASSGIFSREPPKSRSSVSSSSSSSPEEDCDRSSGLYCSSPSVKTMQPFSPTQLPIKNFFIAAAQEEIKVRASKNRREVID